MCNKYVCDISAGYGDFEFLPLICLNAYTFKHFSLSKALEEINNFVVFLQLLEHSLVSFGKFDK